MLLRLQEIRGVRQRSEELALRGSAFFDQLFSYLWRHRVALRFERGGAGGARGGGGGVAGEGGCVLEGDIHTLHASVTHVRHPLMSLCMIPFVSVRHGYTSVDPFEGCDGRVNGGLAQVWCRSTPCTPCTLACGLTRLRLAYVHVRMHGNVFRTHRMP